MPGAKEWVAVIEVASTKSSALPAGGPSRMSVKTTSASSRSTIRCAVVDPTKPPPTTVTFFLLIAISPLQAHYSWTVNLYKLLRRGLRLHIFDDRGGEGGGAELAGAGH